MRLLLNLVITMYLVLSTQESVCILAQQPLTTHHSPLTHAVSGPLDILEKFDVGTAQVETFVNGQPLSTAEEDLLAIPAILESPDKAFIVYGQPSRGVVVVTASSEVKHEVREMMNRMTEE